MDEFKLKQLEGDFQTVNPAVGQQVNDLIDAIDKMMAQQLKPTVDLKWKQWKP